MRTKSIWKTKGSVQNRKQISDTLRKIQPIVRKTRPKRLTDAQREENKKNLLKKYNEGYSLTKAINRNEEFMMQYWLIKDEKVCVVDRYQSGKIRLKDVYRCPVGVNWEDFVERVAVHLEEEKALQKGKVGTVSGIP